MWNIFFFVVSRLAALELAAIAVSSSTALREFRKASSSMPGAVSNSQIHVSPAWGGEPDSFFLT
jgi:hypothetical protein